MCVRVLQVINLEIILKERGLFVSLAMSERKYFWGLKESYRTVILYYMLVSCLLHCRTLDVTTVLWVEWWDLYFKMEKCSENLEKLAQPVTSCEWLILEFESRYIWFCSAKKFFIECLQWCWAWCLGLENSKLNNTRFLP